MPELQNAPSYSLDLLSNHHWVLLTDLVGSFGFVIVGTVVFVRVTVDPTEKIPTAATETWKMTGQIVSLHERLRSHMLHRGCQADS